MAERRHESLFDAGVTVKNKYDEVAHNETFLTNRLFLEECAQES